MDVSNRKRRGSAINGERLPKDVSKNIDKQKKIFCLKVKVSIQNSHLNDFLINQMASE